MLILTGGAMRGTNNLLKAVVFGTVFLTAAAFAGEEKLTVTTYYPSPFGSYKELTSVQMKIGKDYSDNSIAAIDNGLIVQGKVGIGTTSPREKLEVDGTAQMTGFKMATGAGDGKVLTSDADGVGSWQHSSISEVKIWCNACGSGWIYAGTIDNDGNHQCWNGSSFVTQGNKDSTLCYK